MRLKGLVNRYRVKRDTQSYGWVNKPSLSRSGEKTLTMIKEICHPAVFTPPASIATRETDVRFKKNKKGPRLAFSLLRLCGPQSYHDIFSC